VTLTHALESHAFIGPTMGLDIIDRELDMIEALILDLHEDAPPG
jgi:hypothetical protein